MVKRWSSVAASLRAFESDVVPDSGKTKIDTWTTPAGFESDVVPDSGKTLAPEEIRNELFESDVVPDSGKTGLSAETHPD